MPQPRWETKHFNYRLFLLSEVLTKYFRRRRNYTVSKKILRIWNRQFILNSFKRFSKKHGFKFCMLNNHFFTRIVKKPSKIIRFLKDPTFWIWVIPSPAITPGIRQSTFHREHFKKAVYTVVDRKDWTLHRAIEVKLP